jgi:hypothetical protein
LQHRSRNREDVGHQGRAFGDHSIQHVLAAAILPVDARAQGFAVTVHQPGANHGTGNANGSDRAFLAFRRFDYHSIKRVKTGLRIGFDPTWMRSLQWRPLACDADLSACRVKHSGLQNRRTGINTNKKIGHGASKQSNQPRWQFLRCWQQDQLLSAKPCQGS